MHITLAVCVDRGQFPHLSDPQSLLLLMQDYIRELFLSCGLCCEELTILEKKIENRGSKLAMNRKWLQGVFIRNH